MTCILVKTSHLQEEFGERGGGQLGQVAGWGGQCRGVWGAGQLAGVRAAWDRSYPPTLAWRVVLYLLVAASIVGRRLQLWMGVDYGMEVSVLPLQGLGDEGWPLPGIKVNRLMSGYILALLFFRYVLTDIAQYLLSSASPCHWTESRRDGESKLERELNLGWGWSSFLTSIVTCCWSITDY